MGDKQVTAAAGVSPEITIVVVPRDRFSSVIACTESILKHTSVPFQLVFLDFGYSRATLTTLRLLCDDVPAEIVTVGPSIPMTAFRDVLPKIATRYVIWVDNDTFVTPGWVDALLERR